MPSPSLSWPSWHSGVKPGVPSEGEGGGGGGAHCSFVAFTSTVMSEETVPPSIFTQVMVNLVVWVTLTVSEPLIPVFVVQGAEQEVIFVLSPDQVRVVVRAGTVEEGGVVAGVEEAGEEGEAGETRQEGAAVREMGPKG